MAFNVKRRGKLTYYYEGDRPTLSALVTEENGKIPSEAPAEVLKAIELTEYACSLPQITAGRYELRCMEFCGVDHHLMLNQIEVTR